MKQPADDQRHHDQRHHAQRRQRQQNGPRKDVAGRIDCRDGRADDNSFTRLCEHGLIRIGQGELGESAYKHDLKAMWFASRAIGRPLHTCNRRCH